MRPPGSSNRHATRYLVVLPLAAALLFSACTGDTTPPASSGSTGSGPSTSQPTTTTPPKPGEYSYENAGVIANLKYAPDKSTLTIMNHTGAEIPAPGIYMLDARDGHRIAGTVENTAPVPTGDSQDFTVTFASPLEANNVGLMILLIGHANYGAFVPPAPAGD
jgi:hypothetical protein